MLHQHQVNLGHYLQTIVCHPSMFRPSRYVQRTKENAKNIELVLVVLRRFVIECLALSVEVSEVAILIVAMLGNDDGFVVGWKSGQRVSGH